MWNRRLDEILASACLIMFSVVIVFVAYDECNSGDHPQETQVVNLYIDSMQYIGEDGPNPTLHLSPGPVRILLTSLDPGMIHDLVISALNIQTGLIEYRAVEPTIIEFTIPESLSGYSFTYNCSFHPMMEGWIVVN